MCANYLAQHEWEPLRKSDMTPLQKMAAEVAEKDRKIDVLEKQLEDVLDDLYELTDTIIGIHRLAMKHHLCTNKEHDDGTMDAR